MFVRWLVGLLFVLVGSLAVVAQESSEDVRTVWVGPVQVECVGVAPQPCLLVKENADDPYEYFYGTIEGFTYERGYDYELRVRVEPVANPPADASSQKWTLVEVVSTTRTLAGNLWALQSFVNADGETVTVLPDTSITLELTGDQYSGSAGCNRYFGSYMTAGSTVTWGEAATTRRLCLPEAVMEQEAAYLAALLNAASYQIVDETLQIADAGSDWLMTFMWVEPLPLVGTTWTMTGYHNGQGGFVSVLAGTDVTALFDVSGQLSGSAGCNSYSATYEQDGQSLTTGPAISTMMACAQPDGVMEQEQGYLAALERVAAYTIRGDTLELKDGDGQVLVRFAATGTTPSV